MDLNLKILEEQFAVGVSSTDCPYLEGRAARFLFLDGRFIGNLYRLLLDRGYRRHGELVYRPDCEVCRECHILRVPANGFLPSRSQKRIEKKGDRVFRFATGPLERTREKEDLLSAYLAFQHDDINLNPYTEFFSSSFLGAEGSFESRLYDGDRLAGVGIVDQVGGALSSVYFFFHPDYASLSPGVYSMIKEIRFAHANRLSHYYPGYYIKDCDSMSYKAKYRPCQIKSIDAKDWNTLLPESGETGILQER